MNEQNWINAIYTISKNATEITPNAINLDDYNGGYINFEGDYYYFISHRLYEVRVPISLFPQALFAYLKSADEFDAFVKENNLQVL